MFHPSGVAVLFISNKALSENECRAPTTDVQLLRHGLKAAAQRRQRARKGAQVMRVRVNVNAVNPYTKIYTINEVSKRFRPPPPVMRVRVNVNAVDP